MSAEQARARKHEVSYFAQSRSLTLSLVSTIPLVVLYHCGIVQSGYPVRNLAEVWLEWPLKLVGLHAAHVLNAALLAALAVLLWKEGRAGALNFLIVAVMLAEGAFYATMLFYGGGRLTQAILSKSAPLFAALSLQGTAPLLLALGAGVYEELFFRVLLLGGGVWAMRKVFLWSDAWSIAVGLTLSSLLFAAAHHVGPLGQPLNAYDFIFRTICGAALGIIFLVRGLGVAVWTHALYNAMVVL